MTATEPIFDITSEREELDAMTMAALKRRYHEETGRASSTRNRQYLIRRVLWIAQPCIVSPMSTLNPFLIAAALLAHHAPPAAETPAPPAQAGEKNAPDARALADKVIARYVSAKSYRDRGTGTVKMLLKPAAATKSLEFHTAFRRDGGMLWSFSSSPVPGNDPEKPYVVWSKDLKSWNSWWALDGKTESGKPARLAFGTTAGNSMGLSAIVPELLGVSGTGGEFFKFRFSDMRIAGKETVGGVACVMLEGRTVHFEDTNTLWIDETGAIRRFRSRATIDPSKSEPSKQIPAEEAARIRAMPKFDSVTEFNFDPAFDGEVTDKDTEFTPPPAEGEN